MMLLVGTAVFATASAITAGQGKWRYWYGNGVIESFAFENYRLKISNTSATLKNIEVNN